MNYIIYYLDFILDYIDLSKIVYSFIYHPLNNIIDKIFIFSRITKKLISLNLQINVIYKLILS